MVIKLLLFNLAFISGFAFEIPIKRMSSSWNRIHHSYNPIELERKLTINNETIPLFKYWDSEFYGIIQIGKPGQKFKVVFDSEWSDLWIPSNLCSILDLACQIHNKYDASQSSTYQKDGRNVSISLGQFKLIGKLAKDLVHLNKINVTGQIFAQMTEIPNLFSFYKADGVIGLGFQSQSLFHIPSFFDNAFDQKKISKKMFSIYFNRDKASKKGGSLLLGSSDSSHFVGNITYVPLVSSSAWLISTTSITIKNPAGGKVIEYCPKGCTMKLDTSTTTMKIPHNVIDDLSLIIESKKFIMGRYMVDCGTYNRLPPITIVLGGRQFVLKSRDYVQQVSWEGFMICLTAFQKNDDPQDTSWTLSASFMSRFYTIFDAENKKVGFANIR